MYFLNFAFRTQHHYLHEYLNTNLSLNPLLTLVQNLFFNGQTHVTYVTHVHITQKIHRISCKRFVFNINFCIHVLIYYAFTTDVLLYYVVTTAYIWNVCLV